jgi:hypothetical protein
MKNKRRIGDFHSVNAHVGCRADKLRVVPVAHRPDTLASADRVIPFSTLTGDQPVASRPAQEIAAPGAITPIA